MATLKGGDKLEDYLKRLKENIGSSKDQLKVGFLEGATYPDGTSVAQVAFWNEFGHGGPFPAPPRPFFRNMLMEHESEFGDKIAKGLIYYDYDSVKTMRAVGEWIKGLLQESISTISEPPLSQTTLMLRKIYGNNPQEIRARDVLAAQELVAEGYEGATGTQAKPLIWTGHLLNSVDYEVKE